MNGTANGWSGFTHRGGFGSMRYDGSASYLDAGAPKYLTDLASDGTNGKRFSVACWYYDLGEAGVGVLASKGNGIQNTIGWAFYVAAANGHLRFCVNYLSTPQLQAVAKPGTLAWHHAVATITSTTDKLAASISMYVDGRPIGSAASLNGAGSCGSDNASTFQVGNNTGAAGNFLLGYIDDVSVWSRTLSTNEVKELYMDSLAGYPGTLLRKPLPWQMQPVGAVAAGGPWPFHMDNDLCGVGVGALGM